MLEWTEGAPLPLPGEGEGGREAGVGSGQFPIGFLNGTSPWETGKSCVPQGRHPLVRRVRAAEIFPVLPRVPTALPLTRNPVLQTGGPHPPPALGRTGRPPPAAMLGAARATVLRRTTPPHSVTPRAGQDSWLGGVGWALNKPPLSSLCPGRRLCQDNWNGAALSGLCTPCEGAGVTRAPPQRHHG